MKTSKWVATQNLQLRSQGVVERSHFQGPTALIAERMPVNQLPPIAATQAPARCTRRGCHEGRTEHVTHAAQTAQTAQTAQVAEAAQAH